MREWDVRTRSKESFVLTAYDTISLEQRRSWSSCLDCCLIKTRIIAINLQCVIDFSLSRITEIRLPRVVVV